MLPIVCVLAGWLNMAGLGAQGQDQAPKLPTSVQTRKTLALPEFTVPDGFVGLPFHSSVAVTGGSGLFNILTTGELPPGITFTLGPTVVAMGGVPTEVGNYNFQVSVVDAVNGGAVTHDYSIRVSPALVRPEAQVAGVTDTESFHVSDADSSFFPAKIIDNEAYHISDADSEFMPDHIADAEGFHFTDTASVFFPDVVRDPEGFHLTETDIVRASAMVGDAEGFHFGDSYSVTGKVGISPATAPSGTYNGSYSQTFNPAGYTGTASISESGSLPTGVTFKHVLNQNYVVISGTPSVTGSFSFSLTVTDTGSGGTSTIPYTLVINAASQSITLGTLPTPTYGGAAFSVSATATSGLTPTFIYNSGPATGSGAGPYTPTGAGNVSFTASQSGNADYAAAPPVPFVVVVAPATLTVKGNGVSRSFDQPNPVFTDGITGYVNGDSTSVVSGAPTLTTTATPISPVSGSPYAITVGQGTLAATNYNFGLTNGSLTINAAPQTITFYALPSIVHNSAAFPLTARASSGLAVTYSVTGPATISNNLLTVTGTGLVTVTANQSGNANYSAAPAVQRSFTAQ